MKDPYQLDGKRAVVIGGASGIGAATVAVLQRLGAQVTALDIAKPDDDVAFLEVDLRSVASIEAAVDALTAPVDALVASAGVADGTDGLPVINFVGQRHLVESIVDADLMPRGSAVAFVSSAAGRFWEMNRDRVLEWVETPTFDAGRSWVEANPDCADYLWSKQAVCGYVARRAFDFARRGIRLNALMPGPTDTPLARANADVWLAYATDYRDAIGLTASTAEEQAWILAFLCSPAAARLIGVNLMSDAGVAVAQSTGAFESGS